jgi:hypothetical protein
MTIHSDILKDARKANRHHILPGHPIHNMATAVHRLVKKHHPDTQLSPDNIIDELCNEIEASLDAGASDDLDATLTH